MISSFKTAQVVRLEQVTAHYPNGFCALKGLSLSIPKGAFYGLLGLNGAGKTSTLSVIGGLLPAQAGNISIFEQTIVNNPTNLLLAKRIVGWMPQHINMHPFETVEEILTIEAGYHGLNAVDARHRIGELLSILQLTDKRQQPIRQLSGGMKRRVLLARALIHKPKLLILDEPSAGLDLETRKLVWEYLQYLNHTEKVSFLLTTHYLEEAEKLCSHVGILNQGKLVAQGTTSDLLNHLDTEELQVELASSVPLSVPIQHVHILRRTPDSLQVLIQGATGFSECMGALSAQNILVQRVQPVISRLEYGLLNPHVFSDQFKNESPLHSSSAGVEQHV